MYYKWLHHHQGIKYNIQIPPNVFGAGLRINHIGTIIVNNNAKIGEWCDLHACVNIGQDVDGEAPIIGNDVYIGPGAKIYGAIEIGDNTMIGANAVVNKSFTQNDVVIVGVPGKVISEKRNPLARADKYAEWKRNEH